MNNFFEDLWDNLSDFFSMASPLFVLLLIVIGFGVGCAWKTADMNRQLVNKTYGTFYTTSEIFWCGDTIQELIIGNKNRVELTKGEVK